MSFAGGGDCSLAEAERTGPGKARDEAGETDKTSIAVEESDVLPGERQPRKGFKDRKRALCRNWRHQNRCSNPGFFVLTNVPGRVRHQCSGGLGEGYIKTLYHLGNVSVDLK